MIEDGVDLSELPGIGKDLSSHIRELVGTGRMEVLEELGKEVPRSLADLVRLEGVGPKKAKKLWEELGVTSVDDLEAPLTDGRVAQLEGFGQKTAEKISLSIQDFRKHQGRFLLSEVDVLLAPLLQYLEGGGNVSRLEVAGSYRRRKETVGDVDLLASCDGEPSEVMDRFTNYQAVESVEAAGETRGRVRLRSGLPVDLRVVPEESFGAALQYFTGSKEHNVALRTLGVKKGLRINEYGVFRVDEGEEDGSEERLAGEEEAEVFATVGLPWIPPVLREDRGEIQAAKAETLPDLLQVDDIRGDLQMHSTWSDGKQSLREMAEACRGRGYQYLAITDHSQAVTVAGGLKPDQVRSQWEEVERVRAEVKGIHLFRSLEIDILRDGSLDMPDEILIELDLVLVSVHSFMNLGKSEMTDRVIRALEHPQVDILAHPTGRILNRREPFEMDVEAVLQAAASLDVAVELNAHPHRLDLNESHVRRAKDLGVKVAINTDAHSVGDLDYMSYGLDEACRGWIEAEDVLNALPLEKFRRWMMRRSSQ